MEIVPHLPYRIFVLTLVLFWLLLPACGVSAPADDDQTVAQTTEIVTQPTDTPLPPTDTPEPSTSTPTHTPLPATATPTPTDTPEPPTATPVPPTDTPEPTNTPTLENSPTPAPPTATSTPENSPAQEHFELAVEYYDQEQWNQAIAEFQEVIRLEPDFGPAYRGLGYSYAFSEQIQPAIDALEKYLELEPAAESRAEVEQDLEILQSILAERGGEEFDIPPRMALFVFKNYSGEDWNVDIGSYFLPVPANPPDREFTFTTLAIEPGTYTWQAHSANAGYYITDDSGNKAFEFTVAASEVYMTQCCR
ncbi:MAG: tetratricopeptide repeat protein [Chloroflexota bacterium]